MAYTLGPSARVAINSGFATRYVNAFLSNVKVRVYAGARCHVRVVDKDGADEATVQDYPITAEMDVCLNLPPHQDVSFLNDDGGSVAVKETGSIVFAQVADVDDSVTVSDGVNSTVFTFKAAGNGAVGAAVEVAHGADANASATNLFNAINANTNIDVTATNGTPGTVDLVNNLYTGGEITKVDADDDYAVTDFAGGSRDDGFVWVTEER